MNVSFESSSNAAPVKDPWNYWVISLGGNINLSGDNNYKGTDLNGNFAASRTTDESNIDFSFYNSTTRNTYIFHDSTGKSILKTTNEYLEFAHSYVKSISSKWSATYNLNFRRGTYENMRGTASVGVGIEYDIYPYKLSSHKFLVLRYKIFGEKRAYMQETIFNKTKQTLFYHDLGVFARFTQPWGSISSSLTWYNYLHDVSVNNLSFYANAELRLFKGFSINFFGTASMINDQLSLSKDGATQEEVLLRLKALSTSFNYYTGVGLSYRFGSRYNNFVNPRFTNGR